MHLFLGALLAGIMGTSVTPPSLGTSDAGVTEAVQLGACDAWVSRVVQDELPEDAAGVEEVSLESGPEGEASYSMDVTDDELARRFREDLPSLGSISIGVTEAGRVINAVPMPQGEAWTVVDAEHAYGTQETVDFLAKAASEVHAAFPKAVLRIGHLGSARGGWLRPHRSHQAGRDVDVGFYYREGVDPGAPRQPREKLMDVAVNWALLRALVTHTDVQFILVDRRVQRVLRDYAVGIGEDKAWVERLFSGPQSLVKHAPRHRDHFHIRFYSPRAQELGRRLIPLLEARPEENLVIHRVARGDTLGRLAAKYGSTVKAIQAANAPLTATSLRLGRTLRVPLRGPCSVCPVPPKLVVPARLLPPEPEPAS